MTYGIPDDELATHQRDAEHDAAQDEHARLKSLSVWPDEYAERLGECFALGGRYIMEAPGGSGVRLLHTTIFNGSFSKRRITHCIIELDEDALWCPVSDMQAERELFEAYFGMRIIRRYTPDEARAEMLSHLHFGPWAEEFSVGGVSIDELPVEHIESLEGIA